MNIETIEPGIYDISNDAYHSSPGLSRSALWAFKELPKKYWYKYLSGLYEEPKESQAYLIGNAVHTMLLEPMKFYDYFWLLVDVDRRTKIGKQIYQDALDNSNGRILITEQQLNVVNSMVEAVLSNIMIRNVLKPLEIKTCDDASPRAFQLSAMKYGYYLQAAMIYEGLLSIGIKMEHFLFVCIEKSPPFATALYRLEDDALQYGLDLLSKLKQDFKKCQDKGEWRDYGMQTLSVPNWAVKEIEND
jgi:hypothetical protein